MGGDDIFHVYYNSAGGEALFEGSVRERFIRMPNRTLWNQVRLPLAVRLDGCDMFLGGAGILPVLAGRPMVVVVHDCLVFRYPEAKPPRETNYWQRWTRQSVAHAERVIAISHDTAADVQDLLGVSSDKVSVIPQGLDAQFLGTPRPDSLRARALLQECDVDTASYILQVGAYDPHKGADTAESAVRILRDRGHRVVLVQCGAGGPARPLMRDGVVSLGRVGDQDLLSLYAGARVVCVASRHEGFGLPVLEAMAVETPVVASRSGALPEAGGTVALYAEPGDPVSFASAIETVLADSPERDRRVTDGRRRAAGFTWERSAREVLGLLRDVAGKAAVEHA
jgi:alpha-1,3-rhamnosyl/mannosyltransferase